MLPINNLITPIGHFSNDYGQGFFWAIFTHTLLKRLLFRIIQKVTIPTVSPNLIHPKL
jgi:hypothetical protein